MITNDTELNLYKETRLEDDAEVYVVAENFIQLAEDLKITCVEPTKIELCDFTVFLSTWLINNLK